MKQIQLAKGEERVQYEENSTVETQQKWEQSVQSCPLNDDTPLRSNTKPNREENFGIGAY